MDRSPPRGAPAHKDDETSVELEKANKSLKLLEWAIESLTAVQQLQAIDNAFTNNNTATRTPS